MEDDFSVPKEFEDYSNTLFAKAAITEREFVELCLLATRLIDSHWDKRQGMAYHIAGAWLSYKNIDQNALLDQIGMECGSLEGPDHKVVGGAEGVRRKWQEIKKLVEEADRMFPKT